MTLISISISIVIGILSGSKIQIPAWPLLLALVPMFFLPLLKHKKIIITTSLCILAVVGGALRYHSNIPSIDENLVAYYNDSGPVILKGVITASPDNRDTYTQLTVSVTEVNSYQIQGKILLFVPRYPEFNYGDVLQVTGVLETPSITAEFDYQGYLAGRGIYSVAYFPTLELLDTGQGFTPVGWLHAARDVLSEKIGEVLPEPQASLAQGIILGKRGDIPQSVNENFMLTGTTHILAISGQNLSIVAGLFVATGIWFFGKKRYIYIWLALAATWIYASLTGLDAPVVRAALMLSLFLFTDLVGRQRSVFPAVAFAASIMLIFNPALLRDVSFQLSFVSIIGLVVISPALQSRAHDFINSRLGEEGTLVSAINWVTDCLAVTVGVTILIWPITAYYFGIVSVVSPLATFLILPVLAPIIVAGAAASVLGLLIPFLGQATGWIAWLFISYMLLVVNWFADLPVTAVDVELSPVFIWSYFTLLAVVAWAYRKKKKYLNLIGKTADWLSGPSKRFVIPALLVIAILSTLFACSVPDEKLHVSFLDVGQGDAILIQQGSLDVLVDGGPSGRTIAAELGKRIPFWDRTIEMIVLTHSHADHLAGLVEVLKRYQVKQILYTESDSTSSLWNEWQDLVEKENADITIGRVGQVISLGNENSTIIVLNAPSGSATTMDNDGIVLRVDNGKVSFLLTADITDEMELELMMDRANLECTVLKVAHHGSYTASSEAFLSAASPEIAIISVGANNDYGHPNQETIERLAAEVGETNIYRTDLDGTIEFITDGEILWIDTEN
jgi:competence protein ComEC